jgi:hypothetical protein
MRALTKKNKDSKKKLNDEFGAVDRSIGAFPKTVEMYKFYTGRGLY